jgi:hypothetical protein
MQDPLVILFVNNIDSGVLLSLHDYSTSKSDISGADASPLSAITHSPVGIKKEWKRFLKELPIPSRSLDRNEFTTEFGNRPVAFPVVLLKKGTELSILVSAEEIRACRELSDLIHLVRERISNL